MSKFKSDKQRRYVMSQLNQNTPSPKKYELKNNYSDVKVNWKQPTQGELNNFTDRKGHIEYMSPSEYIERVNICNRKTEAELNKYEQGAKSRGMRGVLYYPAFSEGNKERLEKAIKQGNSMEIPWLLYDGNRLREQEGFHRAVACRDLEVKKIPVIVYGDLPLNWKKAPHSANDEIYGI